MPKVPTPQGHELERRIAKLERTVAQMAKTQKTTRTSQSGGANRLVSPDGDVIAHRGDAFATVIVGDPPRTFQSDIKGDSNQNLLWLNCEDFARAEDTGDGIARGRGVQYPNQTLAWWPSLTAWDHSSGTFGAYSRVRFVDPAGEVIVASGIIQTDVGTTGEVRLHDVISGEVTDAVAIGSGASGSAYFFWLHPFNVGGPQSFVAAGVQEILLTWEVRVTGGAGSIYTYLPDLLIVGGAWEFARATAEGGGVFA